MAAMIQVDIVSAEREIFSGKAKIVFAPAVMGEIGITFGHTGLLTKLGPGEIRVRHADDHEENFYISGGMLEVQPKVVTVLSDTAQRAEELDEAAILQAKEAAQAELNDQSAKIDYAKALAHNAELAAQLRAVRRLRKK